MQALRVFAVSTLALTLAGWLPAASADSAEATCEVRKDGDKKKEASGPCSFSQRQGYINIDLRNGKTISLSPKNKPEHFEDQKGEKVVRTENSAGAHKYKWEDRVIIVRFNR
jgi:hypothetical protein